MKKLLLTTLLALVAVIAWMVTGATPLAPLTARVLYHTNLPYFGPRYIIALTNMTSRRVLISGAGEFYDTNLFVDVGVESPDSRFWDTMDAHRGMYILMKPSSPNGRKTTIDYHAFSALEEWRLRSGRWPPLAARLHLPDMDLDTNQTLTINLPAK